MSLACLMCLRRRLYLLPLITAIWIIMSFFISYGIAVSNGHVEPDFPYISAFFERDNENPETNGHTAIEAPERCVFGQLLNIGALMLGMNVVVRYMFLNEVFKNKKMKSVHIWQKKNFAGIVMGVLSALGISIVANFQTEVQRIPHYCGAFLAFGFGMSYCWLQTRISWKLRKEQLGSKVIAVAQLINAITLTSFLTIFVISKTIYKVKEYRNEGTKHDKLRAVYLVSTISEWLLASSILTFILTYTWDFRAIVLETPKVTLNLQQIENGQNNNSSSIPNDLHLQTGVPTAV